MKQRQHPNELPSPCHAPYAAAMHAGFGFLNQLTGRYRFLAVDSLLALGYAGAGLLLGQE